MRSPLVSVEELASRLNDPAWIVCDCRHDLADTEAGRRAFAESHIPGARFVHLVCRLLLEKKKICFIRFTIFYFTLGPISVSSTCFSCTVNYSQSMRPRNESRTT